MDRVQQNIDKKKRLAKGQCKHCSKQRLVESNLFCELHWFANVAWFNLGTGSMEAARKLRQKLIDQNFTCPYTGEKLIIGVNCHLDHKYPRGRFPELAADFDNVEWVCEKVNLAKRDMTKDEFLVFVRQISTYTDNKSTAGHAETVSVN